MILQREPFKTYDVRDLGLEKKRDNIIFRYDCLYLLLFEFFGKWIINHHKSVLLILAIKIQSSWVNIPYIFLSVLYYTKEILIHKYQKNYSSLVRRDSNLVPDYVRSCALNLELRIRFCKISWYLLKWLKACGGATYRLCHTLISP